MMLNRNRSNLDDQKNKYKRGYKVTCCGESMGKKMRRLWRIVGKKMRRCEEEDAGWLWRIVGKKIVGKKMQVGCGLSRVLRCVLKEKSLEEV
ncbi:hypothetical protein Hdeb2414_s0003g00104961 [Helianthus debilis subsp. tardiflorus]